MTDRGGAEDALRRRDEVLQMMYWMRGEGLREAVSPEDLLRFLAPGGEGPAPSVVAHDLGILTEEGLLEEVGGGRWRLSERGAEEAARRFADEFADLTGGVGHGQCSDPECECRTNPEAHLACHREGVTP